MNGKMRVLVALALVLSMIPGVIRPAPALAAGTVGLASFGTAYTENFDTLANSGTSSTTPTGWYLYETGTNANTLYNTGTGSNNAGDTYSFGAASSTERAFGGLLSGSLNPTIGAQFTNSTGGIIGSLAIGYNGEMWRVGVANRGAADRLDFQLSTNATSLSTGTWTDYDSLDFSSPVTMSLTVGSLNGNLAANRTALTSTVSGLYIPNGASFWIRWTDFNITNSDDGLAVDDFTLTAYAATADPAPAVASTSPANGAVNVARGANIGITFSEPVTVTGSWFGIICATTLTHTAAVSGGPVSFTLNPDTDFSYDEACTLTVYAAQVTDQDALDPPDNMAADFAASFTIAPTPIAIHTVQGAGHVSPRNGQNVSLLPAIVTALRTTGGNRGFYLQHADADADANTATSEGIFVYTGSSSDPAALVAVGDLVQVSGSVSEYRGSGASLTLTQLVAPYTIAKISSGITLPVPIVLGTGGRIPPSTILEDDASGSVETTGTFDPTTDGIDLYESLEGMLVQVNDAVAVGPWTSFTSNHELPVVGDNGANAGVRTNRGGVVAQASDYNPERIILNDWISGGPVLPAANVGDTFPGATVGVIDYSFSNFKLQVISMPSLVPGGLTQEVAAAAGLNQISVAAFNVENLAPTDPASKFSTLAELVVSHLQSPDLLSIEEIQDNNGTTNDAVVDASTTWGMLIAAISAAGGPTYQYRQIDPVDDQDGGATGGNIRVGFLFRTDRGLSFVSRPGAGSTTANAVVGSGAGTQLQYSPGRIDPTNAAFSTSRKPLAGEFLFNGHRLFAVANHFNSKSGDDPLFGVNQPPGFSSEVQRNQQATVVHDFVNAILTADPNAGVLVMGDLNDFQWSNPLAALKGSPAILTDLIETLTVTERYSYVYEGNSETLDHILATSALTARPYVYDVVHVNSEFAAQVSDHEPQVMLITLNDPPTADAGGPYSVNEGVTRIITATGTDPEAGPLTYAWDLDGNGTFETPGQSVTFSAVGLDGPTVVTVTVQVTDNGSLTATATTTVSILNVGPAVGANPPSQSIQYSDPIAAVTVSATDIAADIPVTATTQWKLNGGGFTAGLPVSLTLSATTCGAADCSWTLAGRAMVVTGTYVISVTVTDKDGGAGSTAVTIVVNKEDARSTYTGPLYVSTKDVNTSSAMVPLRATIQDITAADPAASPPTPDGFPGDIRNATVSFVNRDAGSAVFAGCGNLPVTLIDPADLRTGTATCNTSLAVDSTGAQEHRVGIIVNGYYTRNHPVEDTMVTVALPGSDMISGGGYLTVASAAGKYPADASTKANFGFNAKYNKNRTSIQGHVNIIYRHLVGGVVHVYQIKSTAVQSLAVQPIDVARKVTGTATFLSKANLQDVTNPSAPVALGGNLTLQMTMSDNGEPGSSDSLAISLWDGSTLLFSSQWTGTKTLEQLLTGGNLAVR